jgi:hypothetical protein
MGDATEGVDVCGSELVGVWSTWPLFPNDPVDERLIFKPDGTGRLEIVNWTLCAIYRFRWSSPAVGRITLNAQDYACVADNFRPEPNDSLRLDNATYAIAARTNAAGQEQLVLGLRLDTHMPETFVLIQRGVAGFEEPDLT